MERNFKWQDVAPAALRAALIAVLTLLVDQLAEQAPSEAIVRGLAAVAGAQPHAVDAWLSKSSSLVPSVPATLSLLVRKLPQRLA